MPGTYEISCFGYAKGVWKRLLLFRHHRVTCTPEGLAECIHEHNPFARIPARGAKVLPTRRNSSLQWASLIRNGIPAAAVNSLGKAIRIIQSELVSEESTKLVRLARGAKREEEACEDTNATLVRLKSSNAALSGATPLPLLDTDIGAESMLDIIGRIGHGVCV